VPPIHAQGKLPVWQTVVHGFVFFGRAWRGLLPAIFVAGLAHALSVYGQVVAIGSMRAEGPFATNSLFFIAGGIVVSCIAQAAMLRVALSDIGAPLSNGSGSLQISRDEFRLLAVNTLVLMLFVVLTFFAVLILTAFTAILSGGGSPIDASTMTQTTELNSTATTGVWVLSVLLFVAFLYLSGRLMLVAPETIQSGRISVLRTFPWTKGNGWRCVLTIFVVGLPGVLTAAILGGMVVGLLGAPDGQAINPETFALQMAPASYFGSEVFAGLAIGAMQVVQAGVLAFLLRGLRSEGTI